jgi:hypothetical protein
MMKVEAGMPDSDNWISQFTAHAQEATRRARQESLTLGLPVFYQDPQTGMDLMEQPDGRRFEIRYIPGAPRERNFEILRELTASAA